MLGSNPKRCHVGKNVVIKAFAVEIFIGLFTTPWKRKLPPTDRLGVYSKAPLRENAGFLVGIGLIGKRKHQLRSDGWVIIRYEILPSYKGTFHKPSIRIPSLTNQDSVELCMVGFVRPLFFYQTPQRYTLGWLNLNVCMMDTVYSQPTVFIHPFLIHDFMVFDEILRPFIYFAPGTW